MSILVVAEHDNRALKPATLNAVTAASEIAKAAGGDVHILVAGKECRQVAEAAAHVAGAAKVLLADDAAYEHGIAENLAPLVVKLAAGYTHVLAPATTSGKNLMPRIAALLDVMQISDISAVESVDTFVRPIYAGNALATVQSKDPIKIITVRGTAFAPAAATGGNAPIEAAEATGSAGLSEFVRAELSKSERPELTSARVIISGGRGMQSGDNFHLLEKVADKLGAAVGASRATIRRVGIIGAGQMGRGIAHVCALAGLDVVLSDVSAAALAQGRETIERNLARQVARGRIREEDKAAALGRISSAGSYADFGDCDMVIEAATEKEAVKREIFKELVPALKPEALIASNTSSISITRLASATDRPAKFIGMHFMNPVPVMSLVELIRGIATDEATFAATRDLAVKLGKTPVAAEDFPAFIVNRILLPLINEAVYTLYEGVGSVASIDTAMKLGANHPMGPLELADFIGLDTCLSIMQVLYEGLADSKYRPCPLLVKYVEAGWLGRKTGRGFYDYKSDPPQPTR